MNRSSRRKFLKQMGALGAAAALPGCDSGFHGHRRSLNTRYPNLSDEANPLAGQSLSDSPFFRARGQIQGEKQNVIFISIDDLNDWISPLGGYGGDVFTPNMARLAARSVNFTQAYCAAPYCGASRSATLSGIAPWKSGLLWQENIVDYEEQVRAKLGLSEISTIPRYFRSLGYKTLGGGKIYHGGFGHNGGEWGGGFDEAIWHEYFNFIWNSTSPNYRVHNNDHRLAAMIGSAYNSPEEERKMPDTALAEWAVSKIRENQGSAQPLFLGIGFYRPHISWFVPKRFYDMYPLSSIKPPQLIEQLSDLNDLPSFAVRYLSNMAGMAGDESMPDGSLSSDHYSLQQMPRALGYDGHTQAIQAYLASVSYVDECLGRVLDALETSGLMEKSVVVLWSDHGWFLGEKMGWRKYKLWEQATRVPLMISAPGGARGVRSEGVVSLLDLFPTLIDVTTAGGLLGVEGQTSGHSLRSLLENPEATWSQSAVTSQMIHEAGGAKIYSIRDSRYRYIMYPDDSGLLAEELYDLKDDKKEKRNLLYYEPLFHQATRDRLRQALLKKIS